LIETREKAGEKKSGEREKKNKEELLSRGRDK